MTQRKFVLSRLKEKGEITRNECLKNHISRLSAIIYNLKQEGFEFDVFYRPVFNSIGVKVGDDYVYKLIKTPKEFKW